MHSVTGMERSLWNPPNDRDKRVSFSTHVTMRQLRAFAETYRTLNLTHAAQTLHLSQPAVSSLIRQFEESLGVRLFDRSPRALRPTKSADDAIKDVEEILSRVLAFEARMRGKAEESAQILSFTCVPALATTIVPQVLAEFKQDMPDVEVIMIDQASPSLIEPVVNEECEFNISPFPYDSAPVESISLVMDHVSVIFGSHSRFERLESVTWPDLAGERIISISKNRELQAELKERLSVGKVEFKPALDIFFIQTALALAANGIGVVLGPAFMARLSPQSSSLHTRTVEDPVIDQGLLVHHRLGHELSKPARHFLKLLQRKLSP